MMGGLRRAALCALFAALAAAPARAALPKPADIVVLSEGAFVFYVNGRKVFAAGDEEELSVFTADLNEDNIISVEWEPLRGPATTGGFFLFARDSLGRVCGTSEGWLCSEQANGNWRIAREPGEGWNPVSIAENSLYRRIEDRAGGVRPVTGPGRKVFMRTAAHWEYADGAAPAGELRSLWQQKRRAYLAEIMAPETEAVYFNHEMRWVEDLNAPQLIKAAGVLDAGLRQDRKVYESIPGGRARILEMLDSTGKALGPNRDREWAANWEIICVVLTRFRLQWKEESGAEREFAAFIQNTADWKKHIEREMAALSEAVFEKTAGRINIVYDVRFSIAEARLEAVSSGRALAFKPEFFVPVHRETCPTGRAPGVFFWICADGEGGTLPAAPPDAYSPTAGTRYSIFTSVVTTNQRLSGEKDSRLGEDLFRAFGLNVRTALTDLLHYEGELSSDGTVLDLKPFALGGKRGEGANGADLDRLLERFPTAEMCRNIHENYWERRNIAVQ